MKSKHILVILISFAVVVLLLTTGYALAENIVRAPANLQAEVASGITYQGYLEDGGTTANGSYDFYFELFDAEIEGTSIMTTTNGDVDVVDGLFTVILDFESSAFNGEARWLEIGVRPNGDTGPYTPLDGRQQITAAPYAMYAVEADTVDGFHASELGSDYQNVVVVAKSGGDYTSIQAAVDSIADASDSNRYLVWVGPGTYEEQVKLQPYIHLVGAGKWLTYIESTVGNDQAVDPPTEATLHLATGSDVRSLSVSNYGDQYSGVAILIPYDIQYNNLKDVSAVTGGTNVLSYGIFVRGGNTNIKLNNVES